MASILSAGNATNSGVNLTGAVDGALEIKTGSGAGTTAVTVSTGQVVTLANALPIASGGTGQTTYTDGQLLIGNSTGNTLTKTTLTAGSGVTITNGAGAITIAASGGGSGFSNIQVFTSNGTFTVPTGITKVKVTVVGGGAGGAFGANVPTCPFSPIGGTGGGAGGAAIEIISGLTPGGTVAVTVGAAGGLGNICTGTGQTAGGTSSFGAYCSATGGATSTVGGLGSGGDLNIRGGPGGQNGAYPGNATLTSYGGVGGSSILGGGGAMASTGGAYGGGGGGGGPNTSGGAGAAGVVIVEY